MSVAHSTVCYTQTLPDGRVVEVLHDSWMGKDGTGPRVCPYCGNGVRG